MSAFLVVVNIWRLRTKQYSAFGGMACLGRCYQILAITGFRHHSNKCAFAEFSKLSARKCPI